MQINDVFVQSGAADWAKKAAHNDIAKKESSAKDPSAKARDKDAALVSLSAHAKGDPSTALVKAHANALPEIREEKVQTAEERIASGYYNTPEFSKELAARLADE
ncbi:hypothetical protein AGMMS49938_08530 [Fibrobacterales bacterium]|nr:hypothetical protein AGMMS49938_08530 [Fibrobacterales bacterium]